LIQNIFGAEDVDIICNIPITNYYQKDKMIWHATSTRKFFIKSAYRIEKERQGRKKGEGSNQVRSQAVWKTIWGLKVPKYSSKVFIWRACNNILPTKDNLKRRGIVDEELYIFCCQEREIVNHILWACPSAQNVWGTSNHKLQKCRRRCSDFMELFEELSVLLNGEDLELFALSQEGYGRNVTQLCTDVCSLIQILLQIDREGLLQYTGKYSYAKPSSQR
jgi:hypothetical protein